MKQILFAIAICGLIFTTSCGNKTNNNAETKVEHQHGEDCYGHQHGEDCYGHDHGTEQKAEATHQHEDGTCCDHDHSAEAAPAQESFEVTE